jgi:hypothetical protein
LRESDGLESAALGCRRPLLASLRRDELYGAAAGHGAIPSAGSGLNLLDTFRRGQSIARLFLPFGWAVRKFEQEAATVSSRGGSE